FDDVRPVFFAAGVGGFVGVFAKVKQCHGLLSLRKKIKGFVGGFRPARAARFSAGRSPAYGMRKTQTL
ncbi:MAG: hypothetical protein FWF96_07215, partial [Kiritimatiellaeota bacterium]|nr:hypothetical protein [Kiritimatiellota bacterium]